MANIDLNKYGKTDIQTTFRIELFIPSTVFTVLGNSLPGNLSGALSKVAGNDVSVFCTSQKFPSANGEAIIWHMPMGPKSKQAGKRTTQAIPLEFVIPSSGDSSPYILFENWANATYNLATGTNAGKRNYSVDGLELRLKKENGSISHRWILYSAWPTEFDNGTGNTESNDLLKCSFTLEFDDYKLIMG